ncbi:hypothetical protein Salat_0711600 [Sesamum alatum]|uniref:Pentatricopeptide repeat (PPR) superfamily protein n=1 Tax=Sesamum alatum TaxID=300844 RepID=A0AAE2CUY8_9LAMI|nr:hypothetical protein Salat_0711600 [Sesamum alatum]
MNLQSWWCCCCSCSCPPLLPLPTCYPHKHTNLCCFLLPPKTIPPSSFSGFFPISKNFIAAANNDVSSSASSEEANQLPSDLFDHQLLRRVSAATDADEVLLLIADQRRTSGGLVSVSDCRLIISAALDRGNADLALSVFSAMRSSFDSGPGWVDDTTLVERWRWSRPDVHTYTLLVKGLAASLRISDALRMIDCVCRVGVSPGEEVPFGKVVRCPSCLIAIAVAQPQQGIQLVSCSKCRYQYELVSGNILTIESEEISMDVPAWKRGLQFLQIMKQNIPAAVHSIVVETPSGVARTHRFATETVDLPAQEGERVTVAVAAPLSAYRVFGPLKLSPRVPNFYPGEPMCLTNHRDGRESRLLRAPPKDVGKSMLNLSTLLPILAVFATGDAASGFFDPSLPQLIAAAAVSSLVVGVSFNSLVLPQLNKLPQRLVDITSIRQQLLSQYDVLQTRIKELKKAAETEVWMLARMCQLENKIYAVGEPSYRARRSRVKRVREGLENSLKNRVELIESYARISSMIEIEVELELDVAAAEAVGNVENIAEQIEQIMETENLEEKWRLQAEANDEAERLLSSETIPTEQVSNR